MTPSIRKKIRKAVREGLGTSPADAHVRSDCAMVCVLGEIEAICPETYGLLIQKLKDADLYTDGAHAYVISRNSKRS